VWNRQDASVAEVTAAGSGDSTATPRRPGLGEEASFVIYSAEEQVARDSIRAAKEALEKTEVWRGFRVWMQRRLCVCESRWNR
jgi:hypothetical protein